MPRRDGNTQRGRAKAQAGKSARSKPDPAARRREAKGKAARKK